MEWILFAFVLCGHHSFSKIVIVPRDRKYKGGNAFQLWVFARSLVFLGSPLAPKELSHGGCLQSAQCDETWDCVTVLLFIWYNKIDILA